MKNGDLSEAATNDAAQRESSTRGTTGFVAGVLLGSFLGAAFALFFAPDRGEKTRGRFRKRMRSLREEALEGIDRAGVRTRKEFRRRQRRFQAELARARERADEASD